MFTPVSPPIDYIKARPGLFGRSVAGTLTGLRLFRNWPPLTAVCSVASLVTKFHLGAEQAAPHDGQSDDARIGHVLEELRLPPYHKQAKTKPKEDFVAADSSPQVERLIKLLPQRRYMDELIAIFIHDINYSYYIIYPPDFLIVYHRWWDGQCRNEPVSLQYMCLLGMICACSIQYTGNTTLQGYQKPCNFGAGDLSEQLHSAVRELAGVIPAGNYHMLNVQRLLHSSYWYKAELRIAEAWHTLNAAVLEAKELEFHKEPPSGTESKHDREMRRRLWCILETWDWQISWGFTRPRIINGSDCDTQLLSTVPEGLQTDAQCLLHLRLQSGLYRRLTLRFGASKIMTMPGEIQEYVALILHSARQYPCVYRFDNPDTSNDAKYPWICSHRYYVYTTTFLLILFPIRRYLVDPCTSESSPEVLSVRNLGLFYSMQLIKTLRTWVVHISRHGFLHIVYFSIFDTAATLCIAILNDREQTVTWRDEILDAISEAAIMLEHLSVSSKAARLWHDVLERLVLKLPQLSASRF